MPDPTYDAIREICKQHFPDWDAACLALMKEFGWTEGEAYLASDKLWQALDPDYVSGH